MKPTQRKSSFSSSYSGSFNGIDFGPTKTIGRFEGNVKNMGEGYDDSTIVLINKADMLPVKILKPLSDGSFNIKGLRGGITAILICLDNSKLQNALIFDEVSPK